MRIILLFLIVFLLTMSIFSQTASKNYRRCFLITYRSTSGFSTIERQTSLKQSLLSVFNNQTPTRTVDEYSRIDGDFNDFFDPDKDEILFFDYGLAFSDFRSQNNTFPQTINKNGVFDYFTRKYFLLKNRYSTNQTSIDLFLDNCFFNCRNVRGKVAPSYVVFPFILTKVPVDIKAEEYYFIILSDYNDPSGRGQPAEIQRMQDGIGNNSRLVLENDFISPMRSKVGLGNTVYEYGYIHYPRLPNRNFYSVAYNIGFKVSFNNIANPVIESNIRIKQTKYGHDNYNRSDIKVRFAHNDNLVIDSILEVYVQDFNKVILSQRVNSEPKDGFYNFSKSVIELPDAIKDKSFNKLDVKYIFYSHFKLLDDSNLGLIYATQPRSLTPYDIEYQAATSTVFLYWFWRILPIAILLGLILLIIALMRGKVQDFEIVPSGFTDTIKRMENNVVTEHYYFPWKEDNKKAVLSYVFVPVYNNKFRIKWGYDLSVKPKISDLNKFDLSAKIHTEEGAKPQEIGKKFAVKDNEYGITIYQDAGKPPLNFENGKRYILTVVTNYEVKHKLPLLNILNGGFSRNNEKPYEFEIGKDLGKIWVGFDPGTTGSSAAFGRDKDKIFFSKVQYGGTMTEINSSVIAFHKEITKSDYENWKLNKDYFHGYAAEARTNLKHKFRSLKKTLGYPEEYPVIISDNQDKDKKLFNLTGQQLFQLQLRGMYNDYIAYLDNSNLTKSEKEELSNRTGNCIAKRAVVAIPNCFTIRRTQAMIDSIRSLGKFDEIISTYEAEAVLFYCIKESIVKSNTRVMIFDMGGATINTSFFDYKNENSIYKIDTLGRIGYGIGGDTIDFCIINAILEMQSVQKALEIEQGGVKKYRYKNAQKLIELANDIKFEIVSNYDNGFELIPIEHLTGYINNRLFGMKSNVAIKSEDHETLFNNSGKVFFDKYIEPIIYKNIQDAVAQLARFKAVADCKNQQVVLVFSGRSTAFPFVQDKVKEELKKQGFINIKPKDLQQNVTMDKLKTIVAEGACWYGILKRNIELSNNKTYYSFTYKHSIDGSNQGAEFKTLIKQGQRFDNNNDGNLEIRKHHTITQNKGFEYDGSQAKIYQVTGDNPKELYETEGMKHKITFVTSVDVARPMKELEMVLRPDDSLEVIAKFDNNKDNNVRAFANTDSVEIADENDEHYTFALKKNN
jgi:molecular chaperone DnaK (HSP70)